MTSREGVNGNKVMVTVTLDREVMLKLEKLRKEQGVAISRFVNIAVREKLAKMEGGEA